MDNDTYTLSKKSVDLLASTAEVVAEHLEHGYVTEADAKQLRLAATELGTEVQQRQYLQPSREQQRTLWGD